jgi:hypothetical protein
MARTLIHGSLSLQPVLHDNHHLDPNELAACLVADVDDWHARLEVSFLAIRRLDLSEINLRLTPGSPDKDPTGNQDATGGPHNRRSVRPCPLAVYSSGRGIPCSEPLPGVPGRERRGCQAQESGHQQYNARGSGPPFDHSPSIPNTRHNSHMTELRPLPLGCSGIAAWRTTHFEPTTPQPFGHILRGAS